MLVFRFILASVLLATISNQTFADSTTNNLASTTIQAPASKQVVAADAKVSNQPVTTAVAAGPKEGPVVPPQPVVTPVVNAAGLTNINLASAKDLLRIKGVNATKARAILDYRKRHGNFTAPISLLKVRGFKKLPAEVVEQIESQVTVN